LAATGPAEGADYKRIEEDWELILNTPDLSFPAPQIVVSMKPGSVSTKQALFLINHHDTPRFNAGGGQIQIWDNDVLRTYKSFAGPTLIREGERVTWTQYMQRSDGKFYFGLSAVSGEAWGTNTASDLGGPISWNDWKNVFDYYDSNLSRTGATITFGDERVYSLKLVQVRKYRYIGDPNPDIEGPYTVFPLQP
ncbi:MAG TPA: hypothetical protein VF170_15275, partial [Planctomycetaceae bacterium]